jgi:hypothetical protein
MKYVVVVLLAGMTLFSCKKKEDPTLFKVKFSVTGTSVNQFKFNTEGLAASTSSHPLYRHQRHHRLRDRR